MNKAVRRGILAVLLLQSAIIPFCFSKDSIRSFNLRTIEKLGQQIYMRDQLASTATDLLLKRVGNPAQFSIGGWIVDSSSGADQVIFFTKHNGSYFGKYYISRDRYGRLNLADRGQVRLGKDQLRKIRARAAIYGNISQPCSRKYNTVVLKDPYSQNYLVYALASTTQHGIIPVGGHYRFTISRDGKKVLNKDRLSRSCLKLSLNPGNIPAGARPVGLFMSHVVSETPVETHVFLSLLHKKKFYVITMDKKIWEISNGKIRHVERSR